MGETSGGVVYFQNFFVGHGLSAFGGGGSGGFDVSEFVEELFF